MKLNSREETVKYLLNLGLYKEYQEPQRASLINELAYDLERASCGPVHPYPITVTFKRSRNKFLVKDCLNPERFAAICPYYPPKAYPV